MLKPAGRTTCSVPLGIGLSVEGVKLIMSSPVLLTCRARSAEVSFVQSIQTSYGYFCAIVGPVDPEFVSIF